MRLSLPLLLWLVLSSLSANAAPSLAVVKFEDKLISNTCNVHRVRGGDVATEMQRQLTAIFTNYSDLRVINSARPNVSPGPHYVVSGTLHSYDECKATNPNEQKVKVAIEIRVFDNHTGKLAFTYTSSANATGSASGLGQTAHLVLNDLAFRVERALTSRKAAVRIVNKRIPAVAKQEYQVKLMRRDPAHQ
jgi:hypothetical protein